MGSFANFTRREWFILCTLGCVNFSNTLCMSLQAPFYPQEAEKKGATSTEYGLVFGIYDLVAFIACPIIGKYMGVIGYKFLLNAGILVTGVSAALFGVMSLVNSHVQFITFSFIIRIFEALGASASMTASFSITAAAFPGSIATMFATLEIFYGLGFIAGPSIGGLLYELGGFQLPFTVVGGLLVFVGVITFFLMPSIENENHIEKPPGKILSVMRLPAVMFAMYSVIAASISMGYYEAILEPHLRQFNLSPLAVGGMFVIMGGTYGVTAPLVGRWCDAGVDPRKITAIGCMQVICSFLLVGPAPFMPFQTTFWVVCVGLVFEGLGYGFILVSSFVDAIGSAVSSGLPDDITTYGIVSGFMSSAFCLGGFIGPAVAGYMYSYVGFKFGSLFVLAVHIALLLGLISFQISKQGQTDSILISDLGRPLSDDNEKQPLTDNSHRKPNEQGTLITKKTYGSVSLDKDDVTTRWESVP